MNQLAYAVIVLYLLSAMGYILFLFRQTPHWERTGWGLMVSSLLLHTFMIAYVFVTSGDLPARNLRETLSIASWSVAGIFIGLQYKFHLKVLGVLAAPLAAAVMTASIFFSAEPAPATTVFNSLWFFFHIISVFLGDAALALAGGLGVFYLMQESTIKNKKRGFFFKRLPSLERIDTIGYSCIMVGFTLLTIGLITGFVYAKLIWGKLWSWDPKEIWSGIAWLLYAALLHGRISLGWRGRKAAVMSIIGFGILLFTFLGVNFILEGHHGAFTGR